MEKEYSTCVEYLIEKNHFDLVNTIYLKPEYHEQGKIFPVWVEGIKHSKRCLYLVGVNNSNYKYPFFVVRLNLIDEVKRLMNDKNFIKYDFIFN